VIVRRLTDAERTEIMVIENLQREGLAPLEEALAYRRLIDLGYSQRKLAERVGSSQATVSKRLALLNLPEAARAALDSGRITLEDAQALTKLNNFPERGERALAHRQNYGGIRAAVEAELEDHQTQKARAAAEEALPAAGARVVPWPAGGFHGRKEAALRQEGQCHFSGSHLEIDVAAHEAEPCHAATVTARSKEARTSCSPQKGRGIVIIGPVSSVGIVEGGRHET